MISYIMNQGSQALSPGEIDRRGQLVWLEFGGISFPAIPTARWGPQQWLQMLTVLQDDKSRDIREAARQRLAEEDDVSGRQSGLGGNVYILGAVS